MRKQVFGRHLKRDTNERKALFKGLASSLVTYERIETTEEKAKSVRGYVEKLVTKARKHNGSHVQSLLQPYLTQTAVTKMIQEIAPRFTNRPGGYVRIIKIGQRFSDNANMVMMEWVEKGTKVGKSEKPSSKTTAKKQTQETVEATTTTPKTTKAKSAKKETTKKTTTKKAPTKKTTKTVESKEKKK